MAYPYVTPQVREFLKENSAHIDFLLDSGAFTAWKSGKPIDLNRYCDFVRALDPQPWNYFALDVIGDPEKTIENYREMRDLGLQPIPIFTRGETLATLEKYYQTSDLVGIGGLVGTKDKCGFVKWLMDNGIKGRKVHWLGFAKNDWLAHYKPFSCDSSTLSAAVRYANMNIYCGGGRWLRLKKKHFAVKPAKEVFEQFAIYEEDPRKFSQQKHWINQVTDRGSLPEMAAKAWSRFSIDIQQKLGTRFFIATPSLGEMKLIFASYKFWAAKAGHSIKQ